MKIQTNKPLERVSFTDETDDSTLNLELVSTNGQPEIAVRVTHENYHINERLESLDVVPFFDLDEFETFLAEGRRLLEIARMKQSIREGKVL